MPFTMPNYPQQINPLQSAISGLMRGAKEAPDMYKGLVDAKYEPMTAQANAAYKQAMAKYLLNPNQALKGLTPIGKSYLEPSIIKATLAKSGQNISDEDAENFANVYNNSQGNPDQATPDQDSSGAPSQVPPDAIANAYNLYRQKQTSDVDTRKRNLFASNIEKTIKYIDPDSLTQYAGMSGSLKKLLEQGKSSFGLESPEYDQYSQSLQATNLLAKQVRQFYGDSIQPEMDIKLNKLVNPATWRNNPKLAKELYNQTIDILGQETGTYRQALQSTEPYRKNNNVVNSTKNHDQSSLISQAVNADKMKAPRNNNIEGRVEKVKSIRGKNYGLINGQWIEQ